MTSLLRTFIGARLAQARRARGLTAVSLAELVEVSSSTISQLEHGKQTPRPDLFDRLSQTLRVPPAFFFQPVIALEVERATKWRSNTTATKFARDRAEIRYDWLREIAVYLEEYLEFPDIDFPKIDLPTDFREITAENIDQAAAACRDYWGIAGGPAPNIVMLLESKGCIVTRGPLHAEGLDAFSEWLPGERPYVFLGSDIGVGVRSRFDASHELGHLILHPSVSKKQFGKPEDFKILERQAHRFAAAFLMPRDDYFKELWAPTLDAFEALKPRWKTSIKGMIVHSHRHGALTDTQYQRAMIQYNRRWRGGEPHDNLVLPEQPKFLARCMEMLIDEKIKTRDQILLDLPFASSDLEELTGLPKGYLLGRDAEVVNFPSPMPKDIRQNRISGRVVSVDFGKRT
ncbi:helix-turn-helix domain-containing protein [Delftia tsuruhatensis]|uniref:helix-turn-helix domain-containing protein n=1 Tax=Delftia tsuruhatensis TaxID=180282 RepID=UPI0028B15B10|nr:helix-turn-helix domain-containing protein [Delftia tsuruhatensis]